MDELRFRAATADDVDFLATMLGEAAVWRPDKRSPTGPEALADPHYGLYLEGWPRSGDAGVIAEDRGEPVGAAWYRTYTEAVHGYGFVAEDVPELSIAVVDGRRGEGIARRLLVSLIEVADAEGLAALSLSVNLENPARHLYASLGFVQWGERRETGMTMVRRASG